MSQPSDFSPEDDRLLREMQVQLPDESPGDGADDVPGVGASAVMPLQHYLQIVQANHEMHRALERAEKSLACWRGFGLAAAAALLWVAYVVATK